MLIQHIEDSSFWLKASGTAPDQIQKIITFSSNFNKFDFHLNCITQKAETEELTVALKFQKHGTHC